jgi:tetratricopeptide (TPR) repeat protein
MIDISTAREKLLEQERLRPGPGQFSALWERGESWQQTFSELVGAERARDTLFEQLVNAASGLEARRGRLQQWSSALQESQSWHDQLASTLRMHQQLWNVDEHGRSLAPNELFTHQAFIDLHTTACAARRAFVELEYLEYRRRGFGRIDENQWQVAWSEVLRAFRQQASRHQHWFDADLTEDLYAERLGWCVRLQRIQMTTQQSWGDGHDVDQAGLRADAATVDRMVDSLRPGHVSNGSPLAAIVGVVVVLAILGFVFGSAGNTSSTTPTTKTAVVAEATPIQAAAAPAGDPGTLNEEGKELLKQGRCEEAIQRFQAAFDANPTAHEAYEPLDNMAFCLYELGRTDEAIAKWQQALAIEPNSPDANAGLGMALYVSGHQDDGIAYFRNALGLKAEYADENWLRTVALWSERAIADSRPLRAAASP